MDIQPGNFRLVKSARLNDHPDVGEVLELLPPGAPFCGLQRLACQMAYDDRGVSYAIDYFNPSRLIWNRILAVCYDSDTEVDPVTFLITKWPPAKTVVDTEMIEAASRQQLAQSTKVRRKRGSVTKHTKTGERH